MGSWRHPFLVFCTVGMSAALCWIDWTEGGLVKLIYDQMYTMYPTSAILDYIVSCQRPGSWVYSTTCCNCSHFQMVTDHEAIDINSDESCAWAPSAKYISRTRGPRSPADLAVPLRRGPEGWYGLYLGLDTWDLNFGWQWEGERCRMDGCLQDS